MKVLQNLLVDLDVLVDTPAAFAFTHWPVKYAKVDIDTYRTYRQDDLWTLFDVPKDEWISKWQSRDASILMQGLPTEFSINFDRILAGNVIQGKVSPVHEEVTVTVNLYPYVVSAEVKAEIQTALNELLGYLIPVTLVFLPTALLTPSYGYRFTVTVTSSCTGETFPWITFPARIRSKLIENSVGSPCIKILASLLCHFDIHSSLGTSNSVHRSS
jgi:hypothetical protein